MLHASYLAFLSLPWIGLPAGAPNGNAVQDRVETEHRLLPDTASRAAEVDGLDDSARTLSAERIAWFGTWDQAIREARRTGRPMLLVSAAPHCRSVSGMW